MWITNEKIAINSKSQLLMIDKLILDDIMPPCYENNIRNILKKTNTFLEYALIT